MQSLIMFLSFITATLLVMGILLFLTKERRTLDERVLTFTTARQHGQRITAIKLKPNPQNLMALFQQASKIFAGKSYTKKMEAELSMADIPLRGEEFFLANLLAALLPGILGLLIFNDLGAGMILGVLGFLFPRLLVGRAKRKRITKFNEQIGEALSVMSNSLRAGFSFLQTMEMVSREMSPPIGDEFGRCLREINLGTPTEQSLVNLGQRIASDDLDLVVTAVLIQRQVGGNLAEVLDSISHTIRERIRIKGEIKTLTAQGRLSGMVIGAMPLVLGILLYLMSPDYIGTLFKSNTGWGLVIAGIISQIIGIAAINKVVNIEV